MAIISLLAGMLLPVLGKSLGAARQTRCAGNEKQLAMATSSYLDDNNGQFMPCGPFSPVWSGFPFGGSTDWQTWCGLLERSYLTGNVSRPRLDQVFWCPANKNATTAYYEGFHGYVTNTYLTNSTSTTPMYQSISLRRVRRVAQTPLLLDRDGTTGILYGYVNPAGTHVGIAYPHAWATNLAFCDNHVAAVRLPDLRFDLSWQHNPGAGAWGVDRIYFPY